MVAPGRDAALHYVDAVTVPAIIIHLDRPTLSSLRMLSMVTKSGSSPWGQALADT